MGKLIAQLGSRPYLDANIVIYAVERHEAYLQQLQSLTASAA